ncbi:GDP-mannose pyrophosphatase NudK [Chitinimonas sp. BJB300]|uniref:GDP-mannose pyrophosphatase NudK n=1 Tax=Chitinimonas sp. BJB300 TaxID=1559339 RepID=UPI000C0E40D6|nr:GDP-mannose pyrophosphatase NudK [Chitinimonas sp. BJB300]PHV12210.1 GDP-mannose pyrophosphatase NudK [Chitinimonas sp. BJB300]TSJ91615.1 GDP-mannose pyrophosphatase NudK [Chitinimonas sp. BJB300]
MRQVELLESQLLSDNWYLLHKHIYRRQQNDGKVVTQTREVYDRGNGAVILLYNRQRGTVVLTRQFRLPTFLNGNADGLLIEACAGLLDEDAPEDCIQREVMEETGYRVDTVTKVFEAYMSPGSVTEILHFFVAEYDHGDKVSEGGGVAHEGEDIEVLEMPFVKALAAMRSGDIRDGKTIILLQYAQIHGLLAEPA